MEEEFVPLSEAKTRLHGLVRGLGGRVLVLVRHGRPVGVLMGFARYRDLVRRAEQPGPLGDRGGRPEPENVVDLLTGGRPQDLARVCSARRVRRLVLFGSAVRGGFDAERSDVDLLVEFEPMPPVEHAEAYFGLQEDLEGLLGRAVDLVEAAAVRNPYFREAVERSHVELYAAA